MKGIKEIVIQSAKNSGMSEDKIEELVFMMVTYLNSGAPYGNTPEGFLRWYTADMGYTF